MSNDSFTPTDQEWENINEWATKHRAECGPLHEVTGARWTYSFTPTGLTTIVTIKCLKCQVEKDVTEYWGLKPKLV